MVQTAGPLKFTIDEILGRSKDVIPSDAEKHYQEKGMLLNFINGQPNLFWKR